jgi:predicted ester cyclase
MATEEENKAVVQRFNELVGEVFRTGNVDVLDEVLAPELIYHQPGAPPDLQSYKRFLAMFRLACPDMSYTLEDMIAEGDKVVDRLTWQATHQGLFLGIPPSGNRLTVTEIHINRIAESRIVERWSQPDTLGLMRQLGVIPSPGQHES